MEDAIKLEEAMVIMVNSRSPEKHARAILKERGEEVFLPANSQRQALSTDGKHAFVNGTPVGFPRAGDRVRVHVFESAVGLMGLHWELLERQE